MNMDNSVVVVGGRGVSGGREALGGEIVMEKTYIKYKYVKRKLQWDRHEMNVYLYTGRRMDTFSKRESVMLKSL